MKRKILHGFKIVYLIGLMLLFFSLFLDWYSFQVYDFENEPLVSWRYQFFIGWGTSIFNSTLNEVMKPEYVMMPLLITILLVITILVSSYAVLFKDIHRAADIKPYKKFAYINGFLLLVVLYYIIVCPVIYLISNELYFPLLSIKDFERKLIYLYSVGPSYILQLVSFPFIFPYSIFYFRTINTFIQKEYSSEKVVQYIIQNSQESLDLDKYIAEEELKQDLGQT
jgi:hypothetical protein